MTCTHCQLGTINSTGYCQLCGVAAAGVASVPKRSGLHVEIPTPSAADRVERTVLPYVNSPLRGRRKSAAGRTRVA